MPGFSKLPRTRAARLGLAAGALLLAVGGAIWWRHHTGRIVDDNARVEGKVQVLVAGISGTVAEVLVEDNAIVERGTELIRLEDGALTVAAAHARARLEAARQGVSAALVAPEGGTGISARQELIAAAERARKEETDARNEFEHLTTLHVQAQLELRRLDALPGSHRPSMEQRNQARLAEIEAEAGMEAARDRLTAAGQARAALEAELRRARSDADPRSAGPLPEALRSRKIELEEARVREAERNLNLAVLRAAVNGRVEQLDVLPGMEVEKGRRLGMVTPTRPEDFRIVMHLPPSRVAEIEPGMACEIVFSAVPDRTFRGVVTGMSGPENEGDAETGTAVRAALLPQAWDVAGVRPGTRARVTVLTAAPRVTPPADTAE